MVLIAGTAVPGKYLGGSPISFEEAKIIGTLVNNPIKILGGPAAKFGFGTEGGKAAIPKEKLKDYYDTIAEGDVEIVTYRLLKENLNESLVDPTETLPRSSKLLEEFAIRGAHIVRQHPYYPHMLIAEIETYRGCPKAYYGLPCSFCIERVYGKPDFRPIKSIVREIEELYKVGVRNFRLGRQPDIYCYMAHKIGESPYPKPNPEAIEKLFKGIRNVAPKLKTLHIDNVNPGTIVHWPKESEKITKIIVTYHTPGDVAAMGFESLDPKVVRENNLKLTFNEGLKAIELINKIGARRGWNGLPHLLPGVNLVFGLKGETEETYEINFQFLKEILKRKLMIRRINIRQVMLFPQTDMWNIGDTIIRKHKRLFKKYKEKIRREIDLPMMRRIVPKGSIIRRAYTEAYGGKKITYARQIASYPILLVCPLKLPLKLEMDFIVLEHSYRSVIALPYPIPVNSIPLKVFTSYFTLLPPSQRLKIIQKRPYKNLLELNRKTGEKLGNLLKYLTTLEPYKTQKET